jgi:hypothetical protein
MDGGSNAVSIFDPVSGFTASVEDLGGGIFGLRVSGSGGGGGTVTQGPAGLVTAPWWVRLSDGVDPLGTVTNPLFITGGTAGPVDQGTPAVVANAWPFKLVDSGGVNVASISATGALKTDGSAVTQPVSGTFFQATQPVSAAALPLPTGAATEATLATRLAEATFTGRINTLGQKTMAASTPVVIASDQAATTGTLANGAETAVGAAAVLVLASNASRKTAFIQNTGTKTVRVGIAAVTATTGLQLVAGAVLILNEPHVPTGDIFAIREGASSSTVLAQEIT